MKKIFRIFFIYIVIALVACFVYSFVKDVPEFLLSGTITRYKIYRAFYSFCKFFPAIVITGFALSHAVVFGRNPEGSTERFSSHMFERYRQVLMTSLLCALLLTLSKEIFVPFLSRKITRLERLPLLVQEYVKAGRQMNIIGKHELAYQYGIHAAKLDPHSSEAQLLIRDTELFAKESNAATKIENVTSALSEEGYTVSELRLLAENAFEKAQYFNAHYYAQTAINIASGRDTNYERLRSIAAQSWNMLSVSHEDALSEETLVFRKKLEGYTSFMQGDNLKAYYIFTELSDSKKLRDPDIERYLKLANERVQNEYFFIDEMLAKQEFETGANIYFSIKKENEGTDIVYIKGI
ncbi:MAG: hypothetical protein IJR49_02410, partial [Treponema sp.]|nr:hypothetical protein [Treponema sp.]